MHKRIIAIKGALDTLDFFTDCLIEAFISIGFEVCIFDINTLEISNKTLYDFVKKPVDFAIAYNNVGFFIRSEGRCIWDILDIYYINIIVDSPIYYTKVIKEYAFPKSVFLCIDREHPYFIDRLRPDVPSAFLPHAAWNYKPVTDSGKRNTDIIYTGSVSLTSVPNFKDIGNGEFSTEDLVIHTYQELLNNPNQTGEHVIEKWLAAHSLNYDINRLNDIFVNLAPVTALVTSYFRQRQLEILLNNGFKVNVYGDNWDTSYLYNHPNFIYHGRISPTEIFSRMSDSKIVLNSMPWFKHGSHERIFNGMLAGSVVISDTSSFLEENFKSGEDIILYDLNNIGAITDHVETILTDSDYFNYVRYNGQQKVLKNHMFINRAIEILEYYNTIKEMS